MTPEANQLVERLRTLVRGEEWELLDGDLNGFHCDGLDDCTEEAAQRGWLIGVYIGALKFTPMRERESFKGLIARIREAAETSVPFKKSGISVVEAIDAMLNTAPSLLGTYPPEVRGAFQGRSS